MRSSTIFSLPSLDSLPSLFFSSYWKPSAEYRKAPPMYVLLEVTLGSGCASIYYKMTRPEKRAQQISIGELVIFWDDRYIQAQYILQMFKTTVTVLILVALASANYSQVLGERLARLSLASYCKRSDVEKWTCGPCKNSKLNMTNVKTFENSSMDTLGFIGVSNQLNAIVLVFRGTLPWDLKNWMSDINFITTAYPLCNYDCKVHRGFYDSFVDIKTQVLDEVALYKQKYNIQKLIVTGHSLGAALAVHAAAHLLGNGTKVTELYTFGLPRIGAPSFVTWFNQIFGKDHFKARVTHARDPVPHLPMESWGFQHVGTEVFYKGLKLQGYEICQDQKSEDNKCSDKYRADVDIIDHLSYYEIDFGGLILACQA